MLLSSPLSLAIASRPVGPLVNLDFTTGSLPAGVTFSRSTTGARYNASGTLESIVTNAPRFDYDPATLALKGVLIEPQRTNLAFGPFSSQLLTVYTNVAVSPDGTSNAYQAIDAAASGTHYAYTNGGSLIAYVSGTGYTCSAYLKAGTASVVQMTFPTAAFGSGQYANFDLSAGVVAASSGVTASIAAAGNGWFRCSITASATASASAGGQVFVMTNNNGSAARLPSYLGTGQSFYVFGPQLEIGSSVSSYIPTTSSAVTRAADQLSLTVTSDVTTLRYTFDDDSTQDVAVSSGSYTVPTNLNRAWIKRIQSV